MELLNIIFYKNKTLLVLESLSGRFLHSLGQPFHTLSHTFTEGYQTWLNNKGTHDCKHYDNSAGIELAQVRIHTLWVHMDVYKIAHRDFSTITGVVAYPLSAEILCILQSLSPMDSTLVSKALSTSVSGRAS